MKFSNYRNYESRNRNIYSKKNLLDMRLSELLDRENELAFQYNTIGIPTDEDLTNSRFAYQYTDDNGVTGWRAGESPDLMGFAASKDKSFEKDFSLLPKGQPKIVMGGPEYPKDIVHNYPGVDDKIAEAIEPKRKHLPIADPPFVLNHSAYEEKQPNQLLQGGVSMEYNPDQEISASETSKQIPVYNENEQNPQGVLKGGISNDPEDSPTNPFDDKEAGIVPVSTKRVENNSDAGEEGLPQKDSVPEDPYLTEDELLGDVMTDQQIAESAKDVNEAFHKALAQKHAQEKEPYFTEEELLGGRILSDKQLAKALEEINAANQKTIEQRQSSGVENQSDNSFHNNELIRARKLGAKNKDVLTLYHAEIDNNPDLSPKTKELRHKKIEEIYKESRRKEQKIVRDNIINQAGIWGKDLLFDAALTAIPPLKVAKGALPIVKKVLPRVGNKLQQQITEDIINTAVFSPVQSAIDAKINNNEVKEVIKQNYAKDLLLSPFNTYGKISVVKKNNMKKLQNKKIEPWNIRQERKLNERALRHYDDFVKGTKEDVGFDDWYKKLRKKSK